MPWTNKKENYLLVSDHTRSSVELYIINICLLFSLSLLL
jgi:hypothetical protein